MASLNAVVAQIADSIDSPFNDMLRARLEDVVISNRALMYRREFERTRQFPSYGIFEHIEEVFEEETCGACTGAFSTIILPDLIAVRDDIPFTFVGTDSRFEGISYMSPEEIEFFKFNKVSGHMPRYTYMNKKAYFFNVGNLKRVLFRGAFTDPRKLNQNGCESEFCFDNEDMSFIEEHLVPLIKIEARRELNIKIDDKEIEVNGGV